MAVSGGFRRIVRCRTCGRFCGLEFAYWIQAYYYQEPDIPVNHAKCQNARCSNDELLTEENIEYYGSP